MRCGLPSLWDDDEYGEFDECGEVEDGIVDPIVAAIHGPADEGTNWVDLLTASPWTGRLARSAISGA